ncbi:MAG: hypothetical protein JWM68_1933 [Verrucomicrobiales bacterium]|nr:hypothetical protein [Verrucomicrobiales bacterium]
MCKGLEFNGEMLGRTHKSVWDVPAISEIDKRRSGFRHDEFFLPPLSPRKLQGNLNLKHCVGTPSPIG